MEQRFLRDVAGKLAVVLSPAGFQSTGAEYRRQRGHVVNCLVVQKHSSEQTCCVDLGVHLDFLPVVGGSSSAPLQEMTVTHCEIRRRLAPRPDLDDHWWSCGGEGGVDDMLAVLDTHGLSFFDRFNLFPDYWQAIPLESIRVGGFSTLLPGTTRVRAALLLARVHAFLGNAAMSRSFAACGLEIAPSIASGPRKALRELLGTRS